MANKSQPDIITSLPCSLSCVILGDWIDVKALARLDSAFCCHIERDELLALFQSTEFINTGRMNSKADALKWVVRRNVKASRLYVTAACISSALWTYLEKHAKFVSDLTVSASTIKEMSGYCKNLKYLNSGILGSASKLAAFRTLLLSNKGLTCLRVQISRRMEFDCSQGIQVQKLLSLQLFASLLSREQVGSFLNVAPNLMKLYIHHRDSILVAPNCPHLRTLAIYNGEASDGSIQALTTSCPHIIHLDLRGCWGLTDAHVLMLVAKLKLRALRLNNCPQLTDLALVSIQMHCANTLHLLTLHSYQMTHSGIANLRLACTKLHLFRWAETLDRNLSGPTVDRRVTMLYSFMWLNDATIENIVARYPSIEIIQFYTFSSVVGQCTALGLHTLTQGCPELHTLLMATTDAYICHLAAIYPQLSVRTGEYNFDHKSVDVMLLPID